MRRVFTVLGVVTASLLALVLVACAAFAAWRIPRERAELRRYAQHVRLDDGPHVTWLPDGRLRVAGVHYDTARGELTASESALACPDAALAAAAIDPNARVDCTAPPEAPAGASFTADAVAAFADVHGHYAYFVALLERAGVVDGQLAWTFGEGHLVIAGDVVDKGPEITRSLWLIKRLEGDAEKAGGRVHLLLGNHEHLALSGRSAIRSPKYARMVEQLGVSYAGLFSSATEIGRWLRRHGVAVRINDTLFVHAGFTAGVLALDVELEELNRVARETLSAEGLRAWTPEERAVARAVWGADGVTSSRAYFDRSLPLGFLRALRGDLRENQAAAATVEAALARYGCRRIVVGHTEGRSIVSLFGGRVIGLCQEMNPEDVVDAASRTEMLLIEGDRISRVDIHGARRPL